MAIDVQQLARYAVHLATGAAAVVRSRDVRTAVGGVGLDVSTKSTSTDLVTAVDRATEDWLVAELQRERPGDGILGEEGGERSGTTGVRWLLDPIDGTVNFVLGLPNYAVSVAAEADATVVAGCVCNPATGEQFSAWRGGGAWLGEQSLAGPRSVQLARAVIATGFAYDRERRVAQAALAARLLGHVADLRRFGSAALDLCSVACGRIDAYYEVGLHPWDYAAGALIAQEAGCSVGGLRGEAPSGAIVVAARPELADDLRAVLIELGAGRLTDPDRLRD